MRILLFFVGLFFLLSCEPKDEHVRNLNEILPQASGNYEDAVDQPETDQYQHLRNYFSSHGVAVDSLHLLGLKERLLPTRFGPDSTLSLDLFVNGKQHSYHRWIFKDSLLVMNAMLNWFDCFGTDCRSVNLMEEINFQKRPMQLFANDTALIYIDSETAEFGSWIAFHDSLGYDTEWNYYLEQGRGGKARWYRFENDKKIKLEK